MRAKKYGKRIIKSEVKEQKTRREGGEEVILCREKPEKHEMVMPSCLNSSGV